ncbi:MAG: CRISPR-associated protein Cas4 [Pseudomonadota bacterium]
MRLIYSNFFHQETVNASNTVKKGKALFDESDLLPISALQHFVFCERQCALIHLERLWAENRLTSEGRILHERADKPSHETRHDVHVARHMSIRSLRLGLAGIADIVEYYRVGPESQGIALSGHTGLWMPYPVEYKRGRPKKDMSDEIQLCAQVLCLEEMHDVIIAEGALFYGTSCRRHTVVINTKIRKNTEKIVEALRNLIGKTKLPEATFAPKCRNCSLVDLCMPQVLGRAHDASAYWTRFYLQEETCENS